jgi:hypothetical protein
MQKTKALLAMKYIGPTAKASIPAAYQKTADKVDKVLEVESMLLYLHISITAELTRLQGTQDHSSEDPVRFTKPIYFSSIKFSKREALTTNIVQRQHAPRIAQRQERHPEGHYC